MKLKHTLTIQWESETEVLPLGEDEEYDQTVWEAVATLVADLLDEALLDESVNKALLVVRLAKQKAEA